MVIRHFQKQFASSPDSTSMLAAARVREEKLKQQVERLHRELTDAQDHHTPVCICPLCGGSRST